MGILKSSAVIEQQIKKRADRLRDNLDLLHLEGGLAGGSADVMTSGQQLLDLFSPLRCVVVYGEACDNCNGFFTCLFDPEQGGDKEEEVVGALRPGGVEDTVLVAAEPSGCFPDKVRVAV